jgi:uncharacterized membrane protein (UPF0127 family)
MEKIGLGRLDRASYMAMNILGNMTALLLAGALLVGCGKPATTAPAGFAPSETDPVRGHLLHAQPKLPTVKVWLGREEMIAEIAVAPVEIATGMMYRTNMPENAAMLFVFSDANIGPKNFYMRNCVVPLSAAYITPDGTIAEIIDLQPGDERGVQSQASNLQFVLEVPQGWFDRHNVKTGAVVRTEHGSLLETFSRQR